MGWTITSDPHAFTESARSLLLREPVVNTVPLTVLDHLRDGHRYGEEPALLAWYTEQGEVTGAVLQTPPFGLQLIALPAGSERELVERLRQRGSSIPDANGTEEAVRRFSECWVDGTGLTAEPSLRLRLFRLDRLVPPEPPPAGSARLASQDDLDLLLSWIRAFRDEANPRGTDPDRSMFQQRVDQQLFWFWLDEQGDPVATAGRTATIAGVSRVAPVYTPPEHRRHGYAAGVTAACSQHALDTGTEQVILFTDLANPTSNAIYQRLGFRPIDDRLVLRYR
jgi:RimJ/RimL family protein N-acetyltransferase